MKSSMQLVSMKMTFPMLAPSAECNIVWTAASPSPLAVPTSGDWANMYPEIERLYVRERRKLRYVMQYIEKKHGFKATQQMYKKRFAKWGFQKNSKYSAASTPTSTTTVSTKSSPSVDFVSMPASPKFANDDGLRLMLMTGVRTWSISFFESLQHSNETAVSKRLSWPEQSEEMNFTFKLVVETLNRGHGVLAGRLVRKAFLLVEELLMLEGPVIVWNVLEILHYLVRLRHFRLCKMLLVHVTALVGGKMADTHPLPAMLRALRMHVASLPDLEFASSDYLLAPAPLLSAVEEDKDTANTGLWIFSGILLSMIEEAWALNAEILFEHFDHRLFQLYLRIHWDSCSLEPPPAMVSAAKKWIADVTRQQMLSESDDANQIEDFIQITAFEKDMVLQRLFARPTDVAPPGNYELLRTSSITALRDHASFILSNGASSAGDMTALLRILASLVTAKVFGDWPFTRNSLDADVERTSRITRAQAGNIACAMRTSLNLHAGYNTIESPLDTVERIRSILALREYSDTRTDPRLIQEMWQLKDALVAADKHQEASEVHQKSYQLLEGYIEDIPTNSA